MGIFDWLLGKKKQNHSNNLVNEKKLSFSEITLELQRIKRINNEVYNYYESLKKIDFKDYDNVHKIMTEIYNGIKEIERYLIRKKTSYKIDSNEHDSEVIFEKQMLEKSELLELNIYSNIVVIESYLLENTEKIRNLIQINKSHDPSFGRGISYQMSEEYQQWKLSNPIDGSSLGSIFYTTNNNIFFYIKNILNNQKGDDYNLYTNFKRLKDVHDIDLSKLSFYSFDNIKDWYLDIFNNYNEYDYFLIFQDHHSNGGCKQFEKSISTTSNKIVSKFKDEYDPRNFYGEEGFDETNFVYNNKSGFTFFSIYKILSDRFPELIKIKIDGFIKDKNSNLSDFLNWLSNDEFMLGGESPELLIDNLNLDRNKDLNLLLEKDLDIVMFPHGSEKDLKTNPFVISYGTCYQSGDMSFKLGVIKK